jgi:hypothetical protein
MQFRSKIDPNRSALRHVRRVAWEAHRRVFCYALALSPSLRVVHDPEHVTIAERLSHVVPFARTLRQLIRRRPGHARVDPALLLLGAQGGHDAVAFSEAIGSLALGSRQMDASPHVDLLRSAVKAQRDLTDDEIRDSEYWAFAHSVSEMDGSWFGANTEVEFLEVTRNFIEWALDRAPRKTRAAGTPFDDKILVAAISDGPLFQIIDGHHRVAASIVRGNASLRVHRTWLRSVTPLQRRLLELNSAQHHAKALRQPVPAKEVETGWVVTANCADRFVRMMRFLERESSARTPEPTFIDVGSSYGWFLGEMKQFGYAVQGIVADRAFVDISTSYFGLGTEEIIVGDLTESVEQLNGASDVVSCFELLNVFDGGRGRDETARLIKAIDRIVDRVLVVDCDEDPGRASTPITDSTGTSLTRLILDNTSFREVVDLGENRDPLGAWSVCPRSRLIALVR